MVLPMERPVFTRLYHGIMDHFHLRVICWFMSVNILCYGHTLYVFPNVFAQPDRSFLYANLSRLASQHVWALLCIFVGVMRLFALIINGSFPTFRLSPYIRAIGSALSAIFWFEIVLGAVNNQSYVLAMDVYMVFFAFDAYSVFASALEINPKGVNHVARV